MTEGGVTTTYTYDDWGRTISKDDGTHSADYTWFAGDKLKQYDTTFPGESSVAFQYDGLGKRRLKLLLPSGGYTDADYTWYRWDAGWNMIGEYAAGTDTGTEWDAGALTRWYHGKAAHADGDPDSAAYNYYLRDHLGSPRATYNQSMAAVARLDFSAYGSPLTTAGLAMDVGYTGHKWDGEMATFYAPYRYYSPGQARWLSRDPLEMVDGPNVYGYVNGDALNAIDSLGLSSCDAEITNMTRACRKAIKSAVKCFASTVACAVCLGSCVGVASPFCALVIFRCAAICSSYALICANTLRLSYKCGKAWRKYHDCEAQKPRSCTSGIV